MTTRQLIKMLSAVTLSMAFFAFYGMADDRKTFPLPVIPDNIREPSLRADYAARHFIDSLDWDNSDYTSALALEQTWADFLWVASHCTADGRMAAIDDFISKTPLPFIATIDELNDTYLYASASPMHNECMYTEVLKALSEKSTLLPEQRAVYSERYRYLATSLPGDSVPDIEIDGRPLTSLLTAKYNLLVIANNGCHICHELLNELATSHYWLRLQRDGTFKVITVEDTDEIDDRFPHTSTPALYLIGNDRVITDRNFNIEQLKSKDLEHKP